MATSTDSINSNLLQKIKKNKTPIYIGLIGPAGAGKSTLINNMKSLVDSGDLDFEYGPYDEHVPTAPESIFGGHTLQREPVEITDFITTVDNRGWHNWENPASLAELEAQVDGHRKLTGNVNWETSDAKPADAAPISYAEKMNCIVVVVSGESGIDAIEGRKTLFEKCMEFVGRRPVVVITHKDKMKDEEIEEMTMALENDHALGKDRVFFIRNATQAKPDMELEACKTLLEILNCCICDGKRGGRYLKQKDVEREKDITRSKDLAKAQEEATRKAEEKKKEDFLRKSEIQKALDEQLIISNRREHLDVMNEKDLENKLKEQKDDEEFRRTRRTEWRKIEKERIDAEERAMKYYAELLSSKDKH